MRNRNFRKELPLPELSDEDLYTIKELIKSNDGSLAKNSKQHKEHNHKFGMIILNNACIKSL